MVRQAATCSWLQMPGQAMLIRPSGFTPVASAITSAEADITHVDMGEEPAQDATDLRFVIAVRDLPHLENVLRALKRVPAVMRAVRAGSASGN